MATSQLVDLRENIGTNSYYTITTPYVDDHGDEPSSYFEIINNAGISYQRFSIWAWDDSNTTYRNIGYLDYDASQGLTSQTLNFLVEDASLIRTQNNAGNNVAWLALVPGSNNLDVPAPDLVIGARLNIDFRNSASDPHITVVWYQRDDINAFLSHDTDRTWLFDSNYCLDPAGYTVPTLTIGSAGCSFELTTDISILPQGELKSVSYSVYMGEASWYADSSPDNYLRYGMYVDQLTCADVTNWLASITLATDGSSHGFYNGVSYLIVPINSEGEVQTKPEKYKFTFSDGVVELPNYLIISDNMLQYGQLSFTSTPDLNTFTVTFDSQGGSAVSPETDIPYGTTISRPATPTKTGYDLSAWASDPYDTYEWDFENDVVVEDMTLYAIWKTHVSTVTFDSQGGSSVEPIDDVAYGDTITAPTAPTRTGYDFGGWYKESGCITPWDFDNDVVYEDTTLFAKWTIQTFTVTFDSNGGSQVSPYTGVEYGSTINEPSTPEKLEQDFDGWYKDSEFETAWDFANDTVTEDVTLYAKWVEWRKSRIYNPNAYRGETLKLVTASKTKETFDLKRR